MHRRGAGDRGDLRDGRLSQPPAGSPLRLARFGDIEAFAARAHDFLLAREAEHNLIFGICSGLRVSPDAYDGPPYLAVVEEKDHRRVVAVAVRTPPFKLVLSHIERNEAVECVAQNLASQTSELPGVLAAPATARAFAEAWSITTGQHYRLGARERIFQLDRVRTRGAAPGRLRPAEPRDRELLIEWLSAFVREALGQTDTSRAATEVDRLLTRSNRTIYIWDDGGPRSMAGAGGPTPNGIRIGPVYTPPELRGRGYATACVAEVSQLQLDSGRRFCFLFTDLANPTSNHVYQMIGYEPVCDVDEYLFSPPAG